MRQVNVIEKSNDEFTIFCLVFFSLSKHQMLNMCKIGKRNQFYRRNHKKKKKNQKDKRDEMCDIIL